MKFRKAHLIRSKNCRQSPMGWVRFMGQNRSIVLHAFWVGLCVHEFTCCLDANLCPYGFWLITVNFFTLFYFILQIATICSMVSVGASILYRPKDKQVCVCLLCVRVNMNVSVCCLTLLWLWVSIWQWVQAYIFSISLCINMIMSMIMSKSLDSIAWWMRTFHLLCSLANPWSLS